MLKHDSPISGIATHMDRYIATAGYDNKVVLWDAISGKPLARSWHDHLANQVAFSSCGRFLVTSSSDYSARVWSIPSLKLVKLLENHTDDVEGIAFHPTRDLIATSCRDSLVRVFDFFGGVVEFKGHTADSISVTWEDDGDGLISSSDDGTIKRWSLKGRKLVEDIDLGGVETDTVALTSKGEILAGNDDGEIILIKGGKKFFFRAHDAGIKKLAFEQKFNKLASLSYDRKVKIWDFDGEKLVECHSAELPPVVWPRSCAFLSEKEIVFGTFGSKYAKYNFLKRSWDLDSIEDTQGINNLTFYQNKVWTVGDAGVVRVDGNQICRIPSLLNFIVHLGDIPLTGGQTGEVFNAATGEKYYQFRSPLNCATGFKRGTKDYVVIGTYTGEGLVFCQSMEHGRIELIATISLHANAIKSISSSKGVLFSVAATSDAAFHSTDSFEILKFVDNAHGKIANGCATAGDGIFVSVSRDLKLRIWSEQTASIYDTPHHHSIKCVAVSEDNLYVGSCDYRGNFACFSLAEKKFTTHAKITDAGISSVIAFKEGFLAASYDGNVYPLEKHLC
ncbi:MAG: WD40 repeat domain-containing protein [Sphingobacteriales bacterium]|nr:MAG: WD40 repeat domain-containing protein [Sphingobacteriales bacterium]